MFLKQMVEKNMYSEAKYFCEQRDMDIPDLAKNAIPLDFPIDLKKYISLEYSVKMISSVEDVQELKILENEKYVGVDSEWRMSMSPL